MPAPLTKDTVLHVESLLLRGSLTQREIAKRASVTSSVVSTINHGRHQLQACDMQRGDTIASQHGESISFLPTPKQIRVACRKIRSGWDDERFADQFGAWTVPGFPNYKPEAA